MDDETFDVPPSRSLIPVHLTMPFKRTDALAEGDILIYPCMAKAFRIGEILEDGSYGGDKFPADNFNCLLSWEWYTVDEMVEIGMRIFKNPTIIN